MINNNFENFIKDNIDSLEGLPSNVGWSKESGWDKLNAKQSKSASFGVLGFFTANKQATPWYYAVAASLTMAVATYFVVQDFSGMERTSQQGTLISETLSPVASDKAGFSIIEKTLSYPPILTVLEESSENKLKQDFVAATATYTRQESIPVISVAPFVDEAKFGLKNWDIFSANTKKKPSPTRQLIFDVQGNLGLVSNNFNTGLEVDLLLQSKNKHAFGVGVKSNYVFTSKNVTENNLSHDNVKSGIATFVTAGYHKNISRNEKKPLWIAVKGGYLVQNNTTVFNDKTLLVEVNVNVNDKIKIAPQIYLTNNLQKAMPGIKVGVILGKSQKDISI